MRILERRRRCRRPPSAAAPRGRLRRALNVGKSSLLNAITGRKALARTSNTPGRTREINFFTLGDDVFLVDLPGYGYARAAKSQVRDWNRLIEDYLKGRASLRRVFLLVDARHGLKTTDEPALALMDVSAVSYQAVLTKADKVSAAALEGVRAATEKALAKRPAAPSRGSGDLGQERQRARRTQGHDSNLVARMTLSERVAAL